MERREEIWEMESVRVKCDVRGLSVTEMTDKDAIVAEGATLVLIVAYDGAPFAGFAFQDGLDTVQGELEQALSMLFSRPANTACAGRTDTGVHARGQVVSLPLTSEEALSLDPRSLGRLLRSLNSLTCHGISVRELLLKPARFSARFDAVSREYRYRIVTGPVPPLFLEPWAWWIKGSPLDAEAMREAAAPLIGEHDFKSFCVARSAEGRPTSRYLMSVDVTEEEVLGEHCLTIRVVGNAFLHSMVRTLVGTLVEVGTGRRSPAWMAEVLSARSRCAAGPTAPARGLTFWSVSYEGKRIHERRW